MAGRHRYLAEINVIPLVDVTLVLLIIFMITAPLLRIGIPVDLPRASARPLRASRRPLVVSVDRRGRIFLQGRPIAASRLVEALRRQGAPGREVHLRADRRLSYGKVVEVMSLIRQAGVERLGMVTRLPRRG